MIQALGAPTLLGQKCPHNLLSCPQATVLEEMPPFPERESSILAKLKRKKGPGAASALDDSRRDTSSNDINGGVEPTPSTVVSPVMDNVPRLGPLCLAPAHLYLALP